MHSKCCFLFIIGILYMIENSIGKLEEKVDTAISDAIARRVLKFAVDFTQKISTDYHKILIFSPISIIANLALMLLGSSGCSYSELATLFPEIDMVKLHTQFGLMLNDIEQPTIEKTSKLRQLDPWHSDGLENTLRIYPSNRNATQDVQVANGVFVQKGYILNRSYRRAISDIYDTEVQVLDFESNPEIAKDNINLRINHQTKGIITDIIPDEIPKNALIILANTLSFEAVWQMDFFQGITKANDFHPNGLAEPPALSVVLMVAAGSFPYYREDRMNCHIIGLPFTENMTTMYIIQPLQSSVKQLAELQKVLDADTIEEMIKKMRRRSSIISLPRMRLTQSLKLRDYLQSMGIEGIFNATENDLSLIGIKKKAKDLKLSGLRSLVNQQKNALRPNLHVSEIFHKVDFNIYEKSTDTGETLPQYRSGPEVIFRANTPFILLVRNDLTKIPIIYGIINEPPIPTED